MASHSLGQFTEGKVRNSQRGKMPLTVDLNYPAPCEDMVLNARFTWDNSQQGQDEAHSRSEPQASHDCEVIDDEVVIISPRIYAQAKNNSSRNLEVRDVPPTNTEQHNGLSDVAAQTHLIPLHCHKRRRTLRNQAVLNWELHFSSEDSDANKTKEVPIPELPQSAPPPETPAFSCPICLGPLSEETSTKCGSTFLPSDCRAVRYHHGKRKILVKIAQDLLITLDLIMFNSRIYHIRGNGHNITNGVLVVVLDLGSIVPACVSVSHTHTQDARGSNLRLFVHKQWQIQECCRNWVGNVAEAEAEVMEFERLKVERRISASISAMNGGNEYVDNEYDGSDALWDLPTLSQ
ncbi:hypothetical protein L3X38_002780 [Prunus dulcis]|uniref:RING/U-box superfamily protein n=1 Tax=Prunus dulcis TaxID=3755 RepID=A0AAD4WUM1_PRUDU|nr:hypothetical protein L3X38_002780 [Prunus dulcis]